MLFTAVTPSTGSTFCLMVTAEAAARLTGIATHE
jgi:hypothetical protein